MPNLIDLEELKKNLNIEIKTCPVHQDHGSYEKLYTEIKVILKYKDEIISVSKDSF